jgi:hypothetical protein
MVVEGKKRPANTLTLFVCMGGTNVRQKSPLCGMRRPAIMVKPLVSLVTTEKDFGASALQPWASAPSLPASENRPSARFRERRLLCFS